MIEPKELRIGNYVEYPLIGISKIDSGHDIDMAIENSITYIPLSEEILLKCRFESKKDINIFRITPKIVYEFKYQPIGKNDKCFLYLLKYENCFNHVVPADNNLDCSFIPVMYLHQLQNLYFALTGKELEVKL